MSCMLQRDLDIRGQLETLTSRLNGKIRNVTCVMQELGYVSFGSFPIPTVEWVQYQKRLGKYGRSHTVFSVVPLLVKSSGLYFPVKKISN